MSRIVSMREVEQHMERDIEKYFTQQAKKHGALAFKFVSPGNAGVPDRIVIRADGGIEFVELKSPGETLRPLQLKMMDMLEAYGQTVTVIDSKEKTDKYWRQRREAT